MIAKRCVVIGLLLIVVLVGVLVACAAPTPTTTPPTTTPIGTPTPTSVPAALAQVIEEAKKEGTVSVMLKSGFEPKSMERMQSEIKQRFGVDLKISFGPTGSFPNDMAIVLMEHAAGAAPSYDMMTTSPEQAINGIKGGALQTAKWSSLLPNDVSPCVVTSIDPYGEVGVSYYSSAQGLMYRTDKVRADEVPQTLSDLANPKWKGKAGVFNYPTSWAQRAFIMGKEKVWADLIAILKNGAIQGRYQDLQNRYLLGEIWLAFSGDSYWADAVAKGLPSAWQNLDYVDEAERPLMLRTGALHPNAAKLVAIYLASPAGAKFTLEDGAGANFCYPGNYAHDIREQGEEQGLPLIIHSQDKALVDFSNSDLIGQYEKEADTILKTTK